MTTSFYDDAYFESTGTGVPKTDRGTYRTLLELQTAIPMGTASDYAKVDAVDGNAKFYLWDVDLEQWVESGNDGSQSQPLNIQLSEISDVGDAPVDNLLQRKSVMGIVRWVSRTITELKTDLQLNDVPNIDATQRSNHSGTQSINTIVNLQSIIDSFTSAIAGKLDTNAYTNYSKGKYTSLAQLQAAHPTGIYGEYAIVDAGTGQNAKQYIWDDNEGWVLSVDGVSISTTDQLTEGGANLYFTADRVRSVLLSGVVFTTNAAILATDSLLVALGKLQAQINTANTAIAGKEPTITASGDVNQFWNGLKQFTTIGWDVIQNIPNTVSQLGGLTPANDDFIQQKGGVLTNRTIDQVKADLDIDEVLCKAYLIENTITIPGYINSFNELWFLQNNLAQHTVRLLQWAGFGTTTAYSFGWPTLSSVGTQTGVTQSIGTEWNQLPRGAIQPSALQTVCGWYFSQSTHYYPSDVSNHGHVTSICFGIQDNGGASLINNARMFIGDTTSNSAPTDVDPRTLANAIGVIQSPTAPLPNRLYFYINGNAVNGVLYDTGMDVSLTTGWRFSVFNIKNTRTVLLRLTDINSDASFNQVVDINTLAANNRPASSSYSPRVWRSTGGTIGTALRLAMNKFYLENKN